jgi:hypothetical protein
MADSPLSRRSDSFTDWKILEGKSSRGVQGLTSIHTSLSWYQKSLACFPLLIHATGEIGDLHGYGFPVYHFNLLIFKKIFMKILF